MSASRALVFQLQAFSPEGGSFVMFAVGVAALLLILGLFLAMLGSSPKPDSEQHSDTQA